MAFTENILSVESSSFITRSFFGLRIANSCSRQQSGGICGLITSSKVYLRRSKFYGCILTSNHPANCKDSYNGNASLIATLLEPPSPDGSRVNCASCFGGVAGSACRSRWRHRSRLVAQPFPRDDCCIHSELRTESIALQRLKTAARFYDRVELQATTDLSDELLQQLPPEKRLLSWYGSVSDLTELSRTI